MFHLASQKSYIIDILIVRIQCYDTNDVLVRCPDFHNLPSQCHLMEDPTDPCCKVPSCPAGSHVQVPVPSYGPGFSGYGQAQLPPQIATGSFGPGPSGNGTNTPSSFTGTSSGQPISGSRSMNTITSLLLPKWIFS